MLRPDAMSAHPFPQRSWAETNGIKMAFHEMGSGPAVILLHGFPELAFSWRHQIAALAEEGWRVIAPDLRGFGATGCQGALEDYRLANLALDILGLMDALGIGEAVVVGHDFGGFLTWTLARDHPDRIRGVVSLNTPYTHRGSQDLPATMLRVRGPENYMVVFQQPGVAEAFLGRDPVAMFSRLMRRPALSLAEFEQRADQRIRALPMSLFTGDPLLMGEPLLSAAEVDVFASAFMETGFEGALNWYRNMRRNWLDTAEADDRIRVPALMVSAADDYFLPPSTTRDMEQHVDDLERYLVPDCGHWTQQEKPEEINRLLIDWLRRRFVEAV